MNQTVLGDLDALIQVVLRWVVFAIGLWLIFDGFLSRPANPAARMSKRASGYIGLFVVLGGSVLYRATREYLTVSLLLTAASFWALYRGVRCFAASAPDAGESAS